MCILPICHIHQNGHKFVQSNLFSACVVFSAVLLKNYEIPLGAKLQVRLGPKQIMSYERHIPLCKLCLSKLKSSLFLTHISKKIYSLSYLFVIFVTGENRYVYRVLSTIVFSCAAFYEVHVVCCRDIQKGKDDGNSIGRSHCRQSSLPANSHVQNLTYLGQGPTLANTVSDVQINPACADWGWVHVRRYRGVRRRRRIPVTPAVRPREWRIYWGRTILLARSCGPR